jgi:hypothetical protein
MMQEFFEPFEGVIECGLLSGLWCGISEEPLAGMVICRLGPYLNPELLVS